jgi:hypothetical protein
MKRIYFLLVTLSFYGLSFSQATLVTIDRLNGPGPTATGVVANITATGLTRNAVIQSGANGTAAFASDTWETSPTLPSPATKYLQWSVTANTNYSIVATSVDITFRRANNQAPKAIQVFYSLDNFITAGVAVAAASSYANNDTAQKILTLALANINSGSGGKITFRLYGWDAANTNGILNIESNATWSANGIALPGVRIRGTVYSELTYASGAWTPFAPSGSTGTSNAFVVNGTYTPSANISLNSLTVRPAGSVTIPVGVTATVNNTFFESTSTQYSSLILNGTLTGTIRYNRHVNGYSTVGVGTGNDLISAPLTGQTFGAFATANSNLRADPNNANRKLFGPFNKTTGTYQIYDVTVNGGVVLNGGIGYRAATQNNGGLSFTGTANNGTITNNIVDSGPQFSTYNLIGNPYPSYINVRDFLEYDVDLGAPVVRNIDLMVPTNAAIYGYDGNAGDGWVIYNLTTATTVNLAPGQGFLVTADAADVAAYDMTFTPSMRRIGTTDDFIPGRRADVNSVHVKLQAAIGASNYTTDVFFNDNCSSGLDVGYDAGVYGSNAPAMSIYTQLVQDNTGVDMAIQSLAYADLGSDIIVPLGINVPQGQQVTVSISESDLPSNIEVYLEDNVTNIFTLLNASDYVFTPNSNLTDTGRFFLRFSGQPLSNPDANINGLQIYTTANARALFIKGQLATETTVDLYDIQGRLVMSSTLDTASNSNQVDVSNLNSGIYVVKLNNTAQQKTQKVILK